MLFHKTSKTNLPGETDEGEAKICCAAQRKALSLDAFTQI
jgi:hypothetical protein